MFVDEVKLSLRWLVCVHHVTVGRVDVVEAASKVLKRVLATQAGYDFMEQHKTSAPDDLLFSFLQPFKTSRKKVSFAGHMHQCS